MHAWNGTHCLSNLTFILFEFLLGPFCPSISLFLVFFALLPSFAQINSTFAKVFFLLAQLVNGGLLVLNGSEKR
jgi:hypothetical protein